MKFGYNPEADVAGSRKAKEMERQTLEDIKSRMGEAEYLDIIHQLASGRKVEDLEPDQQALIKEMKDAMH